MIHKKLVNPCTVCKYSCLFEVRPCNTLSDYYAKLKKCNEKQ